MLKRLAPKGDLFFLHYLDVLPPRFTQSKCPLGQLQITCCKRHQIFGYARLSTLLCEPAAGDEFALAVTEATHRGHSRPRLHRAPADGKDRDRAQVQFRLGKGRVGDDAEK
jgi:hypothetical protein